MDETRESLIGEMSIMDRSGHKELTWDMDKLEEIAVARNTFDNLVRKGYIGFGSKTKAAPKHTISEFDPTLTEVVMVPKTVGG